MPEPARWQLVDFLERLDDWVAQESPVDELRMLVTDWIFTRAEDPYRGARREPGLDNLWFAPVRASAHQGQVVACSYWIEETTHMVSCDSFATLSLPI